MVSFSIPATSYMGVPVKMKHLSPRALALYYPVGVNAAQQSMPTFTAASFVVAVKRNPLPYRTTAIYYSTIRVTIGHSVPRAVAVYCVIGVNIALLAIGAIAAYFAVTVQ